MEKASSFVLVEYSPNGKGIMAPMEYTPNEKGIALWKILFRNGDGHGKIQNKI